MKPLQRWHLSDLKNEFVLTRNDENSGATGQLNVFMVCKLPFGEIPAVNLYCKYRSMP